MRDAKVDISVEYFFISQDSKQPGDSPDGNNSSINIKYVNKRCYKCGKNEMPNAQAYPLIYPSNRNTGKTIVADTDMAVVTSHR